MSKCNEHIFLMTGVTDTNEYKHVQISAVNRQQAMQKFQAEYPELALYKVKPSHPRGRNTESIKKAIIEKR